MNWYTKVIQYKSKKIIASTIFSIFLAFFVTIWHFVLGKSFVWHQIQPISAPELSQRLFYSALVFISLGFLLYLIRFYQLLYLIIVKFVGSYKLYKKLKRIIWSCLILIMYVWIVPNVVNILNNIISFFYNLIGLIINLIPPLGFALAFSLLAFVLSKKIKKSDAFSVIKLKYVYTYFKRNK